MLSSNDSDDGVLTEERILRATRQYDIELVLSLSLRGCGLCALGDAFSRCQALVFLDISRNSLSHLDGIGALASSLLRLNAAENKLERIRGIELCGALEEALLEGNQLRDEKALEPLTALSVLRHLVLQREIALDAGSGETLVLDNPVCADAAAYSGIVRRCFASVLCVDGKYFRGPTAEELLAEDEAAQPLPKVNLEQSAARDDDLDERIFENELSECRAAIKKNIPNVKIHSEK